MLRCFRKLSSEQFFPSIIRHLIRSSVFTINITSILAVNSDRGAYSTQSSAVQTNRLYDQNDQNDGVSNHLDLKPLNGRRNRVATDEKYSCLQASCLQHCFKNWQDERKFKLTASTFALAIGFWPHRRVQLWLEKIGAREPFCGEMPSSWNNIHEAEALEKYKLITGNDLLFPEFQVYSDNWLAASPDAVVKCAYDLPSLGILELKCPFNENMKKVSPWRRIPYKLIPQAQGLMEILDKDWIELYCWTQKGSSLFRIYRDPVYWNLLKIALDDFWWKHVHPAREIYSNYEVTEPLIQLRLYKPATQHELLPDIIRKGKRIVDYSPLLWYDAHED